MKQLVAQLKERPLSIQISIALMVFNAFVLLLWWLLFPAEVVSNGAQVFFIVLWLGAASGIFLGEGWVRLGIAAVVLAFVWGLLNQPSLAEGFSKVTFAEITSKVCALVSVVLLYLPSTHQWFRKIREEKTHIFKLKS